MDLFGRRLKRPIEEVDTLEQQAEIKTEGPIIRSADDKLRRVVFAKRIADVLSQKVLDGSRVYAIRGRWGYGKTSLMNLITEHMEGGFWIEFNPWRWGDADAISKALFQEIANKLKTGHSKDAVRRSLLFRRYGAIMTGAEGPLKAIGEATGALKLVLGSTAVASLAGALSFEIPTLATTAAIIAIAALVIPTVGQLLLYFGKDKWAEPIEDIRDSLVESLLILDRPLIVFVDDIDRLEEEEIRGLIRQVKANANFPNIVFVLLFQQNVVEAALNPIANGDGREFLEKIVQMSFDLPAVPSSTVHRIFTDELALLANQYATSENGFEAVRWGNVLIGCIQPFVNNLRDARRLVSSLATHIPLHAQSNGLEVNIIDLIALETLRVFEPEFHAALFSRQNLVAGASPFLGGVSEAKNREQLDALVALVREDMRETATTALRQLFPQTESAFGGPDYGAEWQQEWAISKRVCNPRFFPKYFELQPPIGELSYGEFQDFVAASSSEEQLKSMIATIRDRKIVPSLVSMLDEFVGQLPTENASVLLPLMFELAEGNANKEDPDPFNTTWTQGWRAASWYIRCIPGAKRGQLALDALKSTGALQVASLIIHLNDPTDRPTGREGSLEPVLTSEEVQSLKDEWLRQLLELAERPRALLERSDLTNLLYRWRDYADSLDEPKAWVEEVAADDRNFCLFIKNTMLVGQSQTVGDRVGRRTESFEKSIISDFYGVKAAHRRLVELDNTATAQEYSHELGILRFYIDAWMREEDDGKQAHFES
ncbi:hypothetical protein NBRC116590_17020 [Pelagimonas sp. KU-00592-HH]|uniref:KAP family P-loop NTPase fold protein n=1 Tax=Pelagimonas sp. KU-00592-HH TaxID=3127651 RepID=UPI00310AAD7F